jgi:hypothetical protein
MVDAFSNFMQDLGATVGDIAPDLGTTVSGMIPERLKLSAQGAANIIEAMGSPEADLQELGGRAFNRLIGKEEKLIPLADPLPSATIQSFSKPTEQLIDVGSKLGQMAIEDIAIPVAFAFEPDETIDQKKGQFRSLLKQINLTDKEGRVNLGERATDLRENLFGEDISAAMTRGGPLAAAGATVGYLAGFNPLTKIPGLGQVLTGEAFEGGIASGLGAVGKANPGLVQAIAKGIAPGAVPGVANMISEIPFAVSESIDSKGNFNPYRFGQNMGIAAGAGAVFGYGAAGIKQLSKQKGFKETLSKITDYTKRKNRFYESKPQLEEQARQAVKVEENLAGGIVTETEMATKDSVPDLFDTGTEAVGRFADGQVVRVMDNEINIADENQSFNDAFDKFAIESGKSPEDIQRVKETTNNINSLIESKKREVDDEITRVVGELGDIPEFKEAPSYASLAEKVPGVGEYILKPLVKMASDVEKAVWSPFFRTYTGTVEEYAPELLLKVRRLDRNKDARLSAYEDISNGFYRNINKLIKKNSPDDKALNNALQDGDMDAARGIFDGLARQAEEIGDGARLAAAQDAKQSLTQVNDMLDSIYVDLNRTGTDVAYRKELWPRSVTDLKGLRQKLDGPFAVQLETMIEKQADKLGKEVGELSDGELDDIYNKAFIEAQSKGMPAFKGQRTVKSVEGLEKYYANYRDSLNKYIYRASTAIEDNKFLGKGTADEGSQATLGRVLRETGLADRVTDDQADEIKKYLGDYFYNSRRGMNPTLRALKNATYSAYLLNLGSTITQMADVGSSLYNNGIGRTAGNFFDSAMNLRKTDGSLLAKLDLNAVIKEMEADPYATGMLDEVNKKAMGLTGFRFSDSLFKETFLRGALDGMKENLGRGLKNPKDEKFVEFIKKQKLAFGDDLPQFLDAIYKGDVDDPNVLFALFNELADFQPISFSEMPKATAGNPNAKVLYALKTWSLRYLDALRRETWNTIKTDPIKGFKNLAKWSIYFGGSQAGTNTLKDYFYGREKKPDELALETALQTFSIVNRYSIDKLIRTREPADKRIREFAFGVAPLPAILSPIFDIGGDVLDMAKEKDLSFSPLIGDMARSSKYVPLVGKEYYSRFGRGKKLADKYDQAKYQKLRAELSKLGVDLPDPEGDMQRRLKNLTSF